MVSTSERTGIGVTERLAEFAAGFDLAALPEVARSRVPLAFLDCIGVALAGSAQPAGRIAAEFARGQGAGDTSVWGAGFATTPTLAALVNGTAAHALDYDDVNWALIGHPSASLVPAVVALAERNAGTGAAMVDAYACGFEVMAKLGRTCMPEHSLEGGWHATCTIGTIGCAVAGGRMLGLSHEQLVNAIGIAISHSSGVVQNFGSMTKPLHAGLAAQSGIQAAQLASAGFTSRDDAMEGKHGFYASFSRDLPVDRRWVERLGDPFELEATGIVVKPYPCGVAGHPAIDAALQLREMLDGSPPRDVAGIEIHATSYTLDKMRYAWPADELQAKFSLPYQVARALVHGAIGLDAFQPAALRDVDVRAVAETASMSLDDELEAIWRARGGSRPCRVVLRMADGRELEALVETSKGNPEVPLTRAELLAKFHDCASLALPLREREQIAAILVDLEQLAEARSLCELLRGAAR